MFADNLDFLMNLTNTQASTLGMACHLDPSHVSRLRSGTRPLPKKPAFLQEMCGYLARRVSADYQRSVMCGALDLTVWPEDEAMAARLIEKWLVGEETAGAPGIEALLTSFASPPQPGGPLPEEGPLPKAKSYYYGAQGKREAVMQFFDLILREKTPRTLLLFSEEEMSWLYEDPVFAARWAARFRQVLQAGNRVKIIHSVARNMNEMLEAVTQWVPIYMTGLIEPYYYPRLRDGVFQRTLFLAPRTAAVVSASVEGRTDGMLNELVTDKDAIAALVAEFERYFSLCRPLMRIIPPARRGELWDAYSALAAADGDVLCLSSRPTPVTLPERTAKAMQERAPESDILRQWKVMGSFLKKRGVQYTEVLSWDYAAADRALPCADLLGAPEVSYTCEEWKLHCKRTAEFAARHGSYRQYLKRGVPPNLCVLVKEGRGAVVTKTSAPGVAFAISEGNLVNAFWSYLHRTF